MLQRPNIVPQRHLLPLVASSRKVWPHNSSWAFHLQVIDAPTQVTGPRLVTSLHQMIDTTTLETLPCLLPPLLTEPLASTLNLCPTSINLLHAGIHHRLRLICLRLLLNGNTHHVGNHCRITGRMTNVRRGLWDGREWRCGHHCRTKDRMLINEGEILQSQEVPPGLQIDGISLNRRNIYLAKTSPPNVFESYKLQHRKDFANFLESRAQEIKIGGRMVLSMLGREETDPTNDGSCYELSALADALDDMVSEDLIKGEELEKFDVPFYSPSLDEIRSTIKEQGSFDYEQGYAYKDGWDPTVDINPCNNVFKNDDEVGRNVSKHMRAVMEPIVRKHFNEIDMDGVFGRFAEKVAALPHEKRFYVDITFELQKIQS